MRLYGEPGNSPSILLRCHETFALSLFPSAPVLLKRKRPEQQGKISPLRISFNGFSHHSPSDRRFGGPIYTPTVYLLLPILADGDGKALFDGQRGDVCFPVPCRSSCPGPSCHLWLVKGFSFPGRSICSGPLPVGEEEGVMPEGIGFPLEPSEAPIFFFCISSHWLLAAWILA